MKENTTVHDYASNHQQTEDDIILEVQDATVTFDMDRGESRVLNDVNIDIRREEIFGIVGESGSGKSMFASALLDAVVKPGVLDGEIIYHPNEGESIDILDLSPNELRQLRWEEIAMVFQGAMSSFNPTMKIRGHFKETLEAHDYEVTSGMEHAKELLSDLYLEPERVLDSYPHQLSGGMRQRALISLSLVLDPNVLVMDEPTAALDLLMQRSILNLLDGLKEKYGITIVFITHDLPLIAGLSDRLAILYAFEFVEIGPADEILTNPTHPYTRALLRAVPNLRSPLSEMRPIGGSSPDPVNPPSGCSYHTRCPLATKKCETHNPPFYNISEEHQSACFHWEKSEDEISLSHTDATDIKQKITEGEQSTKPIVSLNDINVHFKQDNESLLNPFDNPDIVHAVDNTDLEIYENDVVALVGESGCGKTTLGKVAVAAQRPTNGTVTYHNQDIWEAKDSKNDIEIPFTTIRRSLQMIHQDPGSSLNPNRKIRDILEMPLKKWKPSLNTESRRTRIRSLLTHVGMTPARDYAHRYPHQLSGGEKQRVSLLRALLMEPDVILADEAVSALDVSLRVEMMDLMLELQDLFDTSYLFISHNLSNARYFAGKAGGRIGVMYLGEIVEIGPAEEIINDPQHPYTKVLNWSTADLDAEQSTEDPPVRGIDIPDPINPPSGCRFHTRCPAAKEVCKHETPDLQTETEDNHRTACFREYNEDHPYWDSEPLDETADGMTSLQEKLSDD